jgi:hypothetical protein
MISNSTLLSLPSIVFLIAQQTVSEQMAKIYQSTRDGCATDEDMKRLKILREQYIALSREVEDVMGRLLARKICLRNHDDKGVQRSMKVIRPRLR